MSAKKRIPDECAVTPVSAFAIVDGRPVYFGPNGIQPSKSVLIAKAYAALSRQILERLDRWIALADQTSEKPS